MTMGWIRAMPVPFRMSCAGSAAATSARADCTWNRKGLARADTLRTAFVIEGSLALDTQRRAVRPLMGARREGRMEALEERWTCMFSISYMPGTSQPLIVILNPRFWTQASKNIFR